MTGRALRIAVVAHVRHPIAPPFMGGMEAHAWHLTEALVARGHDVTLFASGDSHTSARLVPTLPVHYDRDCPWQVFHGTPRLRGLLDGAFGGIAGALAGGGFDVIHNNSLHPLPLELAGREGLAIVTSLHVPPFEMLQSAVHGLDRPGAEFTACSTPHLRRWWPGKAPARAHVVPNGIAVEDWPFVATGDGSAVWSGRITATKGPHVAIDAARALGLDLTLFGVIEDRDYFDAQIAPRLGGGIRHGGHLGQGALAAEVGRASLFLFTPLWDEPFGLAAAEAMMCGVPVAALPNGAVREVVGPGGAIAADDSAKALAVAGVRALRIPRASVRTHAEGSFSISRMVGRYEALYRSAAAGAAGAIPPARPPRRAVRAALT